MYFALQIKLHLDSFEHSHASTSSDEIQLAVQQQENQLRAQIEFQNQQLKDTGFLLLFLFQIGWLPIRAFRHCAYVK